MPVTRSKKRTPVAKRRSSQENKEQTSQASTTVATATMAAMTTATMSTTTDATVATTSMATATTSRHTRRSTETEASVYTEPTAVTDSTDSIEPSTETITTADNHQTSARKTREKESQASQRELAKERRQARLIRSTESAARRRRLEIEEEVLQRELEAAQTAARLARVRRKIALCDEQEDSEIEEEDTTEQVENWIRTSVIEGERATSTELSEKPPENNPAKSESTSNKPTIEVQTLADALKSVLSAKSSTASQPSYIHELPYFDGSSDEWLAFKTVYEDTAPLFNNVQNMARLRRAVKGRARESIKSLLYSDAKPSDVIDALRRRYGRTDALVIAELEKLQALPKISKDPRDVCVFASQINNSVAAIKGLKRPEYLQAPHIVKIILDKLPQSFLYRWYDFIEDEEHGVSDITRVSQWLNREADRCGSHVSLDERRGVKSDQKKSFKNDPKIGFKGDRSKGANRHAIYNTQEDRRKCSLCNDDHVLYECSRFIKMSVQDRWDMVKKHRVCFKCLNGKHRKETCRKPPCQYCKRWHHSLLHIESNKSEERDSDNAPQREVTTNVATSVCATMTSRAFLKMLEIDIYGPEGSERVLALMDEGSTVTLLDASVANRIGAKGNETKLVIETVGGGNMVKQNSQVIFNLSVKGVHSDVVKKLNQVRTMDNLKLTPQFLDKKRIEKCRHLKKLASHLYYEGQTPTLLIGQDNWVIVSKETRKGKPGQPVASRTALGWVLHGTDTSITRPVNVVNTCFHVGTVDDDMHQLIKEHFSIEALGVQARRPSTDAEGRALALLDKTCKRLEDGRFEIGLLWKSDDITMPESYASAENRLKGIERKLKKDAKLEAEYNMQIQHLLENNYAEEVPHDSDSNKLWYLPHFAVVHPLKNKIRIVFDAAAKSRGQSLNDALLPGPDLLQSLFGVLLRFREGPIAVAADIKEMFLQVKVRPEDRDSLRFLWRKDGRDTPLKEYRMTSVIFGATSSPSSAIYAKNRNADDYKAQYPVAAKAIICNHYMDDYLHSFHDEREFMKVTSEVDMIHKKAGFELRGWASNQPRLLQKTSVESPMKSEVTLGEKEEKTLGLRWLTESDNIAFRANLRNTSEDILKCMRIPTKREVTSAVMSTFDPLGLASPVLIQGKKLIQSIWRSGVGWDDAIELRDHEAWKAYLSDVKLLQVLQVKRCIAPYCTEGEIHVFTDASETAYAAAVYWRTENARGEYDVSLVAAKTRVTPLKPISMPRLELQAALLGSRLAKTVEEELDLRVTNKTYWSDSSIVLSWIKTDPRTFKAFVAHRLAEIEELTKPQEWRWIPSAQNPADDATRNVPNDFNHNHRWFTGPPFLKENESQWPAPRNFKKETSIEEKTETVMSARVITYATPEPDRFSSYKRLWRSTARVLQFIKLCKPTEKVNACKNLIRKNIAYKKYEKPIRKKESSDVKFLPIDADTLREAELILIKRSQDECFRHDMNNINKVMQLDSGSKLRKLDVKLEDGLLRLRGRIDAIKGISREYQQPIVLDSRDKITRLIIEYYHQRFNHGNYATVINEIRQRFWIIGLRSALRSIQHQCQWCKVYKSKPNELPTGDLPSERLRHGTYPFTCTGVDYFGPMVVTVGRRHEKRWGALFTCLTTRAVHIELVPSLSADSMIMALRRFAARRGMPKTIFSDNGTNFVGASKEIKEAVANMKNGGLVAEAEKIGVTWKFIPPGAPNMGGAWERLVRSIKIALEVTLKERHPREEVLYTLLLEAEHIVNSRPLTRLTENLDEEGLTPNHFLIGKSCGAASIGQFENSELVGRDTWKTTQRLADHFWQRWVREYLPTLLPRKINGRTSQADLKVEDIVMIVDSNLPRCTWPRGKIIRVYPGPDGRTRIVDVETTMGALRRPSSKIILLVPAGSPSAEVGATHEGEDVGDRP